MQYQQASTPLSVGSIRQQFSIPANIQLSMYSSEFIRNIASHLQVEDNDPPDVQFIPGSYVFLATAEGEGGLRENFKIQKEQGAAVELMSPHQLKERYPWINTEGVALACRGTNIIRANSYNYTHWMGSQSRIIINFVHLRAIRHSPPGVRNEGWFDPWLLLSAFKKKLNAPQKCKTNELHYAKTLHG